MGKHGSRNRYDGSPSGRTEDSIDKHERRPKRKQNRLVDVDFMKKFPVAPAMMPPGFNLMIPPLNPGNSMPMLVPGMPLPPPLLMNMPLPPPNSDPEEIKKALKMIMANFPVPPPKDAKVPFSPSHKTPGSKKKSRREPVPEAPALSNEEIIQLEIDKGLQELEDTEDDFSFKLTQIPGLLIRRFLKSGTVNEIERGGKRRNQKIRYLDYLDIAKIESKLHTTFCTSSVEKAFKEYKSIGLGKVEGVLPFVDGLE